MAQYPNFVNQPTLDDIKRFERKVCIFLCGNNHEI